MVLEIYVSDISEYIQIYLMFPIVKFWPACGLVTLHSNGHSEENYEKE